MTKNWPDHLQINMAEAWVDVTRDGSIQRHGFSSPEAFEAIAAAYLRIGWDTKYVYSFTWMGRPIIQLPDDAMRLQELIYHIKPDVVIETGVAHGGSLVFYAGLCRAMGKGRVVGVDIEIRPHNRSAIEKHELFDLITLIEGSSVDPKIIKHVRDEIRPDERTVIFLDSNHTRQHVLAELQSYAPLVSVGSYIVAMDGIMRHVHNAPRSGNDWKSDNPCEAVSDFLARNSDFELVEPPIPFNEGIVTSRVSYCPDAFLKRVR